MKKIAWTSIAVLSVLTAGCANPSGPGGAPTSASSAQSVASPWQGIYDQLAVMTKDTDTRLSQTSDGALRVTLPTSDSFATGSAAVTPALRNSLRPVVQVLTTHPELRANIIGHTDNTGNANANVTLSQRRAVAVRSYLISRGVRANRLVAEGRGQTQPVADNATAQGRAANRRIEIDLSLGNMTASNQ